VELGIERPLPDYVMWVQRAARLSVPPWEQFAPDEPQPPRWWWRQAVDVYYAAEADAQKLLEDRASRRKR
jgi:hypothetical protein